MIDLIVKGRLVKDRQNQNQITTAI